MEESERFFRRFDKCSQIIQIGLNQLNNFEQKKSEFSSSVQFKFKVKLSLEIRKIADEKRNFNLNPMDCATKYNSKFVISVFYLNFLHFFEKPNFIRYFPTQYYFHEIIKSLLNCFICEKIWIFCLFLMKISSSFPLKYSIAKTRRYFHDVILRKDLKICVRLRWRNVNGFFFFSFLFQ